MSVEIVIPSIRQREPAILAWSLCQQTTPPDLITIVSNEAVLPFEVQPYRIEGVPTRLLRFTSDHYGVGEYDVALRQNVGIWASKCDIIIIQGDDQIAPPTMVEDVLRVLGDRQYLWGNHRLTDFNQCPPEQIREMAMGEGVSRENPAPPHAHGHWSCYGGMFAARSDFLRDVGGFDMTFNGRHGGEDQALGYRLMKRDGRNNVWIDEPPFSWHSMDLKTGDGSIPKNWLPPISNGCGIGQHSFVEASILGVPYVQCERCLVWKFNDVNNLYREDLLIRYNPDFVTTRSRWMWR